MFDLKKIDTIKVDSLGTTIVKSAYSVVLGSELISNQVDRDFSGTPNWTGGGWSLSGGAWTHVAGANLTTLANTYLTSAPTAGSMYQITVDITTTTAANQSTNEVTGCYVTGSNNVSSIDIGCSS